MDCQFTQIVPLCAGLLQGNDADKNRSGGLYGLLKWLAYGILEQDG